MRKVLVAVASFAMVAALAAPAMAAAADDQADLTVSVNEAISITFSDDQAAFGALNPGSTVDQDPALAYQVITNATNGFQLHIDAQNNAPQGGATGVEFSLSKDGFATTAPLTGLVAFDTAVGNWRSQNAPGTYNYTDGVRVVVGSNATATSFTQSLTYVAVTL